MHKHHPIKSDRLHSALFGFEDGLVSTTGAVIGISAGIHNEPKVIVLAGLVIVAVEAISMGAGEFVSQETVLANETKFSMHQAVFDAVIMFVAYLVAGLIPILPFIFLPTSSAVPTTLVSALIALFALGYVTGRLTKVNALKRGIQILIIGGLATLFGVLVGAVLKID